MRSPHAEWLSAALIDTGGGFLRNPIREPSVTCAVCTTPVDEGRLCRPCEKHRVHKGLADRVAALTYGIDGHQSGWVMYGYKAPTRVGEHHRTVAMLLLHAFTRHGSCPAHLAGMPITHWASVPSLRGRQGVHPLHRIVSGWAEGSEAPLTAVERPAAPRAVSAAHFISGVRLPPESHVLLVDDTWVQGGHAQSAALTLRAAGAAQISTLVVARWIKPGFGKNAAFLRALPDYDPTLCPWTGTHCPSGDGHAGP